MPSRGSKRGWNCYATTAFLGGPQRQTRGQNQKWLPHPCLLGAPKEGGVAIHTVRCRGSPTKGTKSEAAMSPLPSQGSTTPNAGQKSELATSPVPSRRPKRGRTCYATPAFSRVPDAKRGDKIGSGCLTTAFSGAKKRMELLRKPRILGGSPTPSAGTKSEVAASPLPSRTPKEGGVAMHTVRCRGSPTKGTKSQVATSPLPSRGPKRGHNCYVTRSPAFSGDLNKGHEMRRG